MTPSDSDILQVVRAVWGTMLGWPIEPIATTTSPHGLIPSRTGIIQITGVWEGAITLLCDEPLAQEMAAGIFNMDQKELTKDLIDDALGEMTNVIGGNLKALLPEQCYLCLPAVVEGNEYLLRVLKVKPAYVVDFRCQDHFFTLSIFEKTLPTLTRDKIVEPSMAG